jgi:hypothetical protein
MKDKKYNRSVTQKQMGNILESRITVTKTEKNKNLLESNEITNLYKELTTLGQADPTKDFKILVRAQNPLSRHWTLKGFQDDDLKFEDYDEYFSDKVKDSSKFQKFDSISFIVHTSPKVQDENQVNF